MTLSTANVNIVVNVTDTSSTDLSTTTSVTAKSNAIAFTTGAGANQANITFSDTRALGISATESLDLNGTMLVDPFGTAVAITKLKSLTIKAADTNTVDMIIGNVTNGIIGFFGAATHSITLQPGAAFSITTPSAGGYTVTAGTGDLLKVANGAAASSYDIYIIGA